MRYLFAALLLASAACHAAPLWTLKNPTGRVYKDELVRLKLETPAGDFQVKANGAAVPFQTEEVGGKKRVWVAASFGKGEAISYEIAPGKAPAFAPKVSVKREREFFVLDNGLTGVKVPAMMPELTGPNLHGANHRRWHALWQSAAAL
jgi:hypothetical protein